MHRLFFRLGALALGLAIAISGAAAQQGGRAKVGTLSCSVEGGLGLIIGSQKSMICRFDPAAPGWPSELYNGSISKLGIDIGATSGSHMVWGVFSGGSPARGALEGEYGGATAEATVAVGLGANVLVGGSERTIALQPLSVTGQAGINVAAGVALLRLNRVR